uniref:Uncharacterized protein n=1 Tax=Geoglobus ahangari TaxID=113653 RepID=A0A7C3YDA2_9EURY
MDEQLLKIKTMITRWYETYKNLERCESTIYMFVDLINRLVEPYLTELYRTKSISSEDYLEMMAYCEELIQKLKKEFGLQDIELIREHIIGC